MMKGGAYLDRVWREFSDGCWVGDRVDWVERSSSSSCSQSFLRGTACRGLPSLASVRVGEKLFPTPANRR